MIALCNKGKAGEGGKGGEEMEGYHPEVACDGSGQLPIVGTRFHRTGHDFDLCLAEFAKLPEAEKRQFEAIEPPAYRRKSGAQATPATQTGNVRLIQDGIIIPDPTLGDDGKSSFPHIVELNGAQSAHDEACEWQQYKTKQTHITVQLQDKQGAPPPRPLVAPM